MRPQTRYAEADGGFLAYQTVGRGPPDLLFTTNPMHNIDVMWERPSIERFFTRLAVLGRLTVYNPRGTGVASPLPPEYSGQEWMDDARTVLDAVGVERATIIGDTEGAAAAMMFAATYPERTSALVLINAFARFLRDEDYPWGLPSGSLPQLIEAFKSTFGTGSHLDVLAPSAAGDAQLREWYGRYQRLGISGPGVAAEGYGRYLVHLDMRSILPAIQAPTLVLHRAQNRFVPVEHGRYLGRTIPGATYVELSGDEALYFAGDSDAITDEIRHFLTGVRDAPESDRVLATIMFTDMVASTEHAAAMGDSRWRETIDAHDLLVQGTIDHFRGRRIKTIGDGVLATFDGPARAIRCARTIEDEVRRRLGIDVRAGLHTGEVELRDDDIGGIAVALAARVMGEAGPGEVVVSSTVKDLVVGSGIEFDDRGEHQLKGVPGEWRLFAVKA